LDAGHGQRHPEESGRLQPLGGGKVNTYVVAKVATIRLQMLVGRSKSSCVKQTSARTGIKKRVLSKLVHDSFFPSKPISDWVEDEMDNQMWSKRSKPQGVVMFTPTGPCRVTFNGQTFNASVNT
jgi:hypothetical protein